MCRCQIRLLVFLPDKTLVEPRVGTGRITMRDLFADLSLVNPGGVMTVFAEFDTGLSNSSDLLESRTSVDIVVGTSTLRGRSLLFLMRTMMVHGGHALPLVDQEFWTLRPLRFGPQQFADENKVFLLLGSHMLRDPLGPCFAVTYRDISVVVGEVTQSTFTSRSGVIEWDAPTSPPPRISKETQAMGLEKFLGGGGSGIVMGDWHDCVPSDGIVARR
ncbi:hypothetical protein TcYC6_0100980 [Trypanosoma cruzi]|nr:hypothetical protein TcYC6_0100980 [Trypanosoma cruzi]